MTQGVIRNRLESIGDGEFHRFVAFARSHPRVVSVHHLLQKLTIFDFVAPLVERERPARILEVGCGIGIHSALLSGWGDVSATELVTPGSFVGADNAVDVARRRVFDALAERPIAFAYNDGYRLPYADASFDLVFHNSVIEHVPDVVAFNREIARVLRPGGLCVCITGTPALCWLRFLLGSVLKFPLNLALAAARELVPAAWLKGSARWLLSRAGAGEALICKAESRLSPIDAKLRDAWPATAAGESSGVAGAALVEPRHAYARLRHYLDSPDYNRIVLDEVARDLGVEVGALGPMLRRHFSRALLARLQFWLTPRTHGQHYRDWIDEKREWQVERWVERFDAGGLAVERVLPYRFHHVFEATPRRKWDAYAYYYGARWIHALLRRYRVNPSLGSEILIVARKRAG